MAFKRNIKTGSLLFGVEPIRTGEELPEEPGD